MWRVAGCSAVPVAARAWSYKGHAAERAGQRCKVAAIALDRKAWLVVPEQDGNAAHNVPSGLERQPLDMASEVVAHSPGEEGGAFHARLSLGIILQPFALFGGSHVGQLV